MLSSVALKFIPLEGGTRIGLVGLNMKVTNEAAMRLELIGRKFGAN